MFFEAFLKKQKDGWRLYWNCKPPLSSELKICLSASERFRLQVRGRKLRCEKTYF